MSALKIPTRQQRSTTPPPGAPRCRPIPTKTLAPYFSYSENFQPVSGLSQFGDHYRPLSGKQYEPGIKWQPVRGAMIRAAYYDIIEDNHLVPDPANPLNSIQGGSVTSKGFEFQANYNVVNDLTFSFAYTHNSTRVSGQNHQQDNTPQDLARPLRPSTWCCPMG